MKLEIDAKEVSHLIREFFRAPVKEAPIETEQDYMKMVSGKWGKLPPDMELVDGELVARVEPPPADDFAGIVPGTSKTWGNNGTDD